MSQEQREHACSFTDSRESSKDSKQWHTPICHLNAILIALQIKWTSSASLLITKKSHLRSHQLLSVWPAHIFHVFAKPEGYFRNRKCLIDWRLTLCPASLWWPVTPAALSSPAMFAAPRTRSHSRLPAVRLSALTLRCTLSSHYFCYSNFSINYAQE